MSERAASLADALDGQLPLTVERDGLVITLTAYSQDGNVVTVHGSISRDGESVQISWPVIVTNPPTLVPDPNGEVVQTDVGRDGVERTWRFTDDPFEGLLFVLVDVARGA